MIVLSNKMLTLEDVKRLEAHARVTFQSKGVWSQAETSAALQRAIGYASSPLPGQKKEERRSQRRLRRTT